jgi:Cell division protein 48 (CDC48), N-terminal domain.
MEAYTRDVGRGVARVDYEVMDMLNLQSGDVIEIKGKGEPLQRFFRYIQLMKEEV